MLLMKVVALHAENVVGQNVIKFLKFKSVVNKKVQTSWTFLFTVFEGFGIFYNSKVLYLPRGNQ